MGGRQNRIALNHIIQRMHQIVQNQIQPQKIGRFLRNILRINHAFIFTDGMGNVHQQRSRTSQRVVNVHAADLPAHRIPQRRHMLARPAIRAIAAPVLNVQITIQLQPYPIVFRTAHLRPITPCGSFLDVANLALLKIQQSTFGDMGREQVEWVDTGHGWFPRSY